MPVYTVGPPLHPHPLRCAHYDRSLVEPLQERVEDEDDSVLMSSELWQYGEGL